MDSNLLRDYRASTSWDDILNPPGERRAWKKVALAAFLCLAGAGMLTGGLYIWFTGPKNGGATALLVLGSICFIPGFYHTRIAYLAWKGVQGYSLNSIPDFEPASKRGSLAERGMLQQTEDKACTAARTPAAGLYLQQGADLGST